MKIKKARIIKVGNSFYFTVPKQYINNGIINKNLNYDLEIREAI